MKNDTAAYYFMVYCHDSLLWWLLLICLFNCLITGTALVQIGNFITDSDGKRLSLLKLQGTRSISKLNHYLSKFSTKALKMAYKSLILDYAFMPFLFLAMVSISCLVLRHAPDMKKVGRTSFVC
jgi:hypothetical protein